MLTITTSPRSALSGSVSQVLPWAIGAGGVLLTKTSRSFTADPGSARSARHFVLQAAGNVPPGLRDAIAVMVGELAMNAVQHARTDFEVIVELTGGALRVQVTDSAGSRLASAPMPPPGGSGGRGLPIVAGLADDWGIVPSPHGPGKTIWFTIAIPSPARQGFTAEVRTWF